MHCILSSECSLILAEDNVSGRHFWEIRNEKQVTVSQMSFMIDIPYINKEI